MKISKLQYALFFALPNENLQSSHYALLRDFDDG